jgi:hypothetical protein
VPADFVARWNGTTWSALGSGLNGPALTLAALPNGVLVAGGFFTTAGGLPANRIASWNGATWTALSTGMNDAVRALAALPNGNLVAVGQFTSAGGVAANRVARWNGTSWSALGTGMDNTVHALTVLPDGDFVAGGDFTTASGLSTNFVARWDGTTWSAVGMGTNNFVRALTSLPNGDVVAGGSFTAAGGVASAYVARLTTTCPATSTSLAAGCPSSGGSNTLAASTLPWVDATFRATGTGLPTNALVLTVWGFTQFAPGSLPLTLAFAQAGPGCDQLVSLDILGVLPTSTGTAQSQIFLPNAPPIVGTNFYHQMIPLELDAFGNLVAVTATNSLQLTAGVF